MKRIVLTGLISTALVGCATQSSRTITPIDVQTKNEIYTGIKHKLIVGKFDEFQFFTGTSYDMDASLAFAYQKEQEDEGPTFLFFNDAMKEVKF